MIIIMIIIIIIIVIVIMIIVVVMIIVMIIIIIIVIMIMVLNIVITVIAIAGRAPKPRKLRWARGAEKEGGLGSARRGEASNKCICVSIAMTKTTIVYQIYVIMP